MADFPIYYHIRYDATLGKDGKLHLTCTDVSDHDFVEVVRCKYCKNFIENPNDCISGYGLTDPRPMDFCPYGERREVKANGN